MDGKHSLGTHVKYGVPQQALIGTILFLVSINDLPKPISSCIRQFADDCLLYKPIKSVQNQYNFQKDIDEL